MEKSVSRNTLKNFDLENIRSESFSDRARVAKGRPAFRDRITRGEPQVQNCVSKGRCVRLYMSSSIYYPFRLYYRTFGLYTFTLTLLSLRIYCYLHVPVILLRTHFLYTQLCVSLPQNTGLHYILNKKNDNVN